MTKGKGSINLIANFYKTESYLTVKQTRQLLTQLVFKTGILSHVRVSGHHIKAKQSRQDAIAKNPS